MDHPNNNQPTTKTTNSHSDILPYFKQWLSKWNDNILTQDDVETQSLIQGKLSNGFSQIEKLLHASDQKVMLKARGSLPAGSNEANKQEVLAMFENQKKPWYKSIKKVSTDITYIKSILENIYEIKNRRSHECFQLRAENAKLREEIRRLRAS